MRRRDFSNRPNGKRVEILHEKGGTEPRREGRHSTTRSADPPGGISGNRTVPQATGGPGVTAMETAGNRFPGAEQVRTRKEGRPAKASEAWRIATRTPRIDPSKRIPDRMIRERFMLKA